MTSSTRRPFEELHQAKLEVEAAIVPFVEALSGYAAYNGAVLFVPDEHHAGTAGAVAVVNATNRPARQLSFTQRHIRGRRVDLQASTLGDMFREPQPQFLPSRLNPKGHQVFGLPVGNPSTPQAMIQLAFDVTTHAALPPQEHIQDEFVGQLPHISRTTRQLLEAGTGLASLSNALMLNTPTTPNAFVIMWDVVGSTRLANHRYAWLRHFLNSFGLKVAELAQQAGGTITSLRGDGQNIVLPLPSWVDRADKRSVRRFVKTVALPLVAQIEAAHQRIGRPLRINIHLSYGLANVETSYLGEVTGAEFFSLARLLKH